MDKINDHYWYIDDFNTGINIVFQNIIYSCNVIKSVMVQSFNATNITIN